MLHCDYVSRYFASAIVVFDGYRNPSIKYITHQRRTCGKNVVEVSFNEEMKLTTPKVIFLANVTNKQNFIDMLSRYLQLDGCVTHHAQGDADLLTAHTAVQSAASKNTVVIADDTALVILLCYAEPAGFLLVHAVLSKVINEEGPPLEHQRHTK